MLQPMRKQPKLTPEKAEQGRRLSRIWGEKRNGMSQGKAAQLMGFSSQSTVSQYLNSDIPLNKEAILKFSALLGVDPTDIDPSFFDSGVELDLIRERNSQYNVSEPMPVFGSVPLISWVRAGMWDGVEDNYHAGDGEKLIHTTKKVGPNSYALRVHGDSMENPAGKPTFPEGAIIIIDPSLEPIHGKCVIVRLDDSDEATFKQLIKDGGTQYLKPLNPRYPVLELDKRATFCGVVVQTIIDND